MKDNYVKKQHFIPQFALKSFQNKEKKIAFTNIEKDPLKLFFSQTENLMQEKDFYEIKTEEGKYILRNSLEDDYSSFENYISPKMKYFLELSKKPNFQEEFIKIIENNTWAEIEGVLMFYLATLLIRSKNVKKIFHSNSKYSIEIQNIMYLLAKTSKERTVEYAKKMFSGQDLEFILQFIKGEEDNNYMSLLTKHIMEKYQVRICKVTGKKKLFLSDNPVIVQKLEGEDYILPLSPDICMILVPIKIKGKLIEIDTQIYPLDDKAVDKLNKYSIINTDKLVIISNEEDLKFIDDVKTIFLV